MAKYSEIWNMIELQPYAQSQFPFIQIRARAAEAPAHSEYVSRAVKFHQLLEVSRAGHCYCRLFSLGRISRAVQWSGAVVLRRVRLLHVLNTK